MNKFRYPCFSVCPWSCLSCQGQFLDHNYVTSCLFGFVKYSIIHVRTQIKKIQYFKKVAIVPISSTS